MLKTLLICADGSAYGLNAAKKAVNIAKLHDACVIVLHIQVDRGHTFTVPWQLEVGEPDAMQKPTVLQKANLEATMQLCQTAGIRFRCRIESGSAAEQIIRVAEDEGVDLIVMGPKGLSDWKALSLGAVNHPV
jgi:nucleotide-binding universal stress UspA family protein